VQAFTKIQTGKLILPHLAIVYDNEAWSFFDQAQTKQTR
jgi:hypothetical protein